LSRSFSQTAEFTCPQCKKDFQAEIWLTVDAGERPDLMERIRNNSIHTLRCDNCGHENAVDAPLLIHLPEKEQLFFVPAQGTDAEQDQEIAEALLGQLVQSYDSVPDYFRETKLAPRDLLPVLLDSDDLQALSEHMNVSH